MGGPDYLVPSKGCQLPQRGTDSLHRATQVRGIVVRVSLAALRPLGVIGLLALLTAAAPLLAFPELVPAAHRITTISWLTAGALAIGILSLHGDRKLRWGLCVFAVAVLLGWWMTPNRDAAAIRHFSGIGLGVLTMGVIARWCTSQRRLVAAAVLFSLAAAGVLLRGSAAAFNSTLAAPASQFLVPEFATIPLALPGTELSAGQVNTNALGGTAVMVLPACVGLAAASLMLVPRARRILVLLPATGASIIAAAIVIMTASRSALGAALLTLVTLGWRWRRGRRHLLVALLIVGGGLAYATYAWRSDAPENFDRRLADSARIRVAILQDGLDRLKGSPWLGIGISQFRSGPRASLLGDDQLAHVHNIGLQVALDSGLVGFAGYVWTFGLILVMADRAAAHPGAVGRIAAGAGLSLIAVHIFGLADAIALGSKVGVFQWWAAGLVLASLRIADRSALKG
jgi:putative inorganic carbon (HCO3(-)) transporter